jgi:hypothetical protein
MKRPRSITAADVSVNDGKAAEKQRNLTMLLLFTLLEKAERKACKSHQPGGSK